MHSFYVYLSLVILACSRLFCHYPLLIAIHTGLQRDTTSNGARRYDLSTLITREFKCYISSCWGKGLVKSQHQGPTGNLQNWTHDTLSCILVDRFITAGKLPQLITTIIHFIFSHFRNLCVLAHKIWSFTRNGTAIWLQNDTRDYWSKRVSLLFRDEEHIKGVVCTDFCYIMQQILQAGMRGYHTQPSPKQTHAIISQKG